MKQEDNTIEIETLSIEDYETSDGMEIEVFYA